MPWLSVFTVLGKGRVSIRSGSKISKPHGSWWHNQGLWMSRAFSIGECFDNVWGCTSWCKLFHLSSCSLQLVHDHHCHVGEWRAEAEVPSWPCSFGHSRLLGESPYCHFHLTGLLHILIVIYELIGWWMFHNFSMLSWNCCLWKSPSKSSYLRMVLFGCSLNCHLSIYAAECFLRQWEWGVHVWIVVKKHELNCWKWAGFSQTVLLLISCYYGRL
jgi:hypothetical protein